ncbi:MAG: hypothetical protein K0S58_1932 [Nitrospira sp.]|jgi:hypothetical protein|nr:hypothetical protein [Nitrospira sp.]
MRWCIRELRGDLPWHRERDIQDSCSPPRIAAAELDDLFDHPAGSESPPPHASLFSGTAKWFFNGLLVFERFHPFLSEGGSVCFFWYAFGEG